jgi:hypothetical protein
MRLTARYAGAQKAIRPSGHLAWREAKPRLAFLPREAAGDAVVLKAPLLAAKRPFLPDELAGDESDWQGTGSLIVGSRAWPPNGGSCQTSWLGTI